MRKAGGGGGGGRYSAGTADTASGAGAGKTTGNATAGAANSGSGAGGTRTSAYVGAAGGSGVIYLRYPNSFTITVGAGLTSSTTTDGSDKITTFTAGTDTISFS